MLVSERHLLALGAAARSALITGGSGIAMGLPENFPGLRLGVRAPDPALPPAA